MRAGHPSPVICGVGVGVAVGEGALGCLMLTEVALVCLGAGAVDCCGFAGRIKVPNAKPTISPERANKVMAVMIID